MLHAASGLFTNNLPTRFRDEFAHWAPVLGRPRRTSLARAVVYPIAETMTSARLSGFSLSLLVLGGCNALEVANHWLVVAGPPGWDPIPAPECP